MKCARCNRLLKGAFTWWRGNPFGPVCSEKMNLTKDPDIKAEKIVRDDKTIDMFEQNDKE